MYVKPTFSGELMDDFTGILQLLFFSHGTLISNSRLLSFANEFMFLFHLDSVEIPTVSTEFVPFNINIAQMLFLHCTNTNTDSSRQTQFKPWHLCVTFVLLYMYYMYTYGGKLNLMMYIHHHIVLLFHNFRTLASVRWLCKHRKYQAKKNDDAYINVKW